VLHQRCTGRSVLVLAGPLNVQAAAALGGHEEELDHGCGYALQQGQLLQRLERLGGVALLKGHKLQVVANQAIHAVPEAGRLDVGHLRGREGWWGGAVVEEGVITG